MLLYWAKRFSGEWLLFKEFISHTSASTKLIFQQHFMTFHKNFKITTNVCRALLKFLFLLTSKQISVKNIYVCLPFRWAYPTAIRQLSKISKVSSFRLFRFSTQISLVIEISKIWPPKWQLVEGERKSISFVGTNFVLCSWKENKLNHHLRLN